MENYSCMYKGPKSSSTREKNYFVSFLHYCKESLKYLILGLYILLNSSTALFGQLSEQSRISILTCSPGEELYSLFGHSAIRVSDSVLGIDYVFNYGTFDFNTPNFYLKFMRGELDYMLSVSHYDNFIYEYNLDGRGITEQVLRLRYEERNKLFEALSENYRPANRAYKYHFFYDNCATRVRDIVVNNIGLTVEFPERETYSAMSFRDAIAVYLKNRPWTRLGLDLLLGQPTDEKLNATTVQFLPDFLMYQFADARISEDGRHLVSSTSTLLDRRTVESKPGTFTPAIVLSLLAIMIIAHTWLSKKQGKSTRPINVVLLSICSMIGLLIIFLWFFTSHSVTGPNWNILWAHPLYLLLFIPTVSKNSTGKYLRLIFASLILIFALVSPFLSQQIPVVLIPIWILLIVKLMLFNTSHKGEQR